MASKTRAKRGGEACGAINCTNARRKCPSKSFFRFPKDEIRCQKWVQNSRRLDLVGKPADQLYNGGYVLCADHFDDEQFRRPVEKKRLNPDAIPTIIYLSDSHTELTSKKLCPKQRKLESQIGSKESKLSDSGEDAFDFQSLDPVQSTSHETVVGSDKMTDQDPEAKTEVKVEIDDAEEVPSSCYKTLPKAQGGGHDIFGNGSCTVELEGMNHVNENIADASSGALNLTISDDGILQVLPEYDTTLDQQLTEDPDPSLGSVAGGHSSVVPTVGTSGNHPASVPVPGSLSPVMVAMAGGAPSTFQIQRKQTAGPNSSGRKTPVMKRSHSEEGGDNHETLWEDYLKATTALNKELLIVARLKKKKLRCELAQVKKNGTLKRNGNDFDSK